MANNVKKSPLTQEDKGDKLLNYMEVSNILKLNPNSRDFVALKYEKKLLTLSDWKATLKSDRLSF